MLYDFLMSNDQIRMTNEFPNDSITHWVLGNCDIHSSLFSLDIGHFILYVTDRRNRYGVRSLPVGDLVTLTVTELKNLKTNILLDRR